MSDVAVWCWCHPTPEPQGYWVYPDDEHADTCGFEFDDAKRGERRAAEARDRATTPPKAGNE
jgi:hypothetical protein